MKRTGKKAAVTSLVLGLCMVPMMGFSQEVPSNSGSHTHAPVMSTKVESLPKAKKFAPDKGPAKTEQSTEVLELDEKGNIKNKTFTKKNIENVDNKKMAAATRTVTVLAVADEEYRASYSDWQTRIQQIVESSDDAFIRDHGIDFQVKAVGSWNSSGSSSEGLLANLNSSINGGGYDFVVGFTKDARFDAGGIAYVYNSSPGTAYSVNLDQGMTNTAKAAQHEFSHNYGLPHDAQGSGIKCIMNYDYSYTVDYWDASHNSKITANKGWYGG